MASSTSSARASADDRHRRVLWGQRGALPQARDLSQEELSVRASLHRTEISQIERGLRLCRIDTVIKLLGSLDVSADDLLAGIRWEPGDVRLGAFVDRGDEDAEEAAR